MKKKNYHITEDDSDEFYSPLVDLLNRVSKPEDYNQKYALVKQDLKSIIQNEIDDNEEEKEI
jgi:hypothetical protein